MTLSTSEAYEQAKTQLRSASETYYLGTDLLMDDASYDALLREVEEAEASHPEWVGADSVVAVASGAAVGGDVTHSTPLLSLDNAMGDEELRAWFERTQAECRDLEVVVEPKLDGLAVVARYDQGQLVQVVTRGDGFAGEDVTYRGQHAVGLPHTLSEKVAIELRGEVYMSDADFEAANALRVANGKEPFVNARNGAAGALRNQSDSYTLPLSFACYDAYGIAGSHSEVMDLVKKYGATLARDVAGINGVYRSLGDVQTVITELGARRVSLGFAIDGAVVKANPASQRQALGVTSRAPKWAIAFKYPPEERLSTLLEVIAQVGRTGVITPRARIVPVAVGGVVVEYATMHNWELVVERGWKIGDTVNVRRAGEVIPELVAPVVSQRSGDETDITIPQACPRCGSAIDKSEKRWRCVRGRSCGLVETLRYAVSRDALDIEGLGEKLVSSLVEAKMIGDLADIFDLRSDQLSGLERMGDTSAANVLEQIDRARGASLARVFTALGIRSTGRSLCRRLAVRFTSLDALASATVAELQEVDGIGSEKALIIRAELDELGDLIARLKARGLGSSTASATSTTKALDKMKVVVTGSMSGVFADRSRNEMNELIEAHGGVASSAVSAATSLVVVGDKAGSKVAKANSLGVRVISEAEFAALIGV